jgi:hypothetical protein
MKLPKSIRKYIRKEKARIRREVLDIKKQKELIEKLYNDYKPNSQASN